MQQHEQPERKTVHVTSVARHGVYGHETTRCDPAGCAGGVELYWDGVLLNDVLRGGVYVLVDTYGVGWAVESEVP